MPWGTHIFAPSRGVRRGVLKGRTGTMVEIPTGKMAELNCVTKKTLRLYHEMGLLEPVRVDDETGYRFYSYDQCSTIDMIQQLQSLGISLAEIKELLDDDDPASLANLLEEHRTAIDEEILRLLIARQNATQLLVNYRRYLKKPLFDTVILEHMAERRVLTFDILNPQARVLDDDVVSFLQEWELNLRYTKRHMLDSGIPASLFHHVGCCITKENLEKRAFVLDASFILIQDDEVARSLDADVVPAGDYLTLYKESYAAEGKHNAEIDGLNTLLNYAEQHGFAVAGDYYGEIIAETPAFHCDGREMLFKLEMPVLLD